MARSFTLLLCVLALTLLLTPARCESEQGSTTLKSSRRMTKAAIISLARLLDGAKRGDLEAVETALSLPQANVNAEGPNSETALMLASSAGHIDIVNYLLSHGANALYQADNGETPLSLAEENDHEIVATALRAAMEEEDL